jgi:ATP-dependent Clp protease ATP-binding subunit ClpB
LIWDVFIEYLGMQLDKLTIKAQEALQGAQQTAHTYSNQEVDADHLMSALLAQTDSLVPALLEKLGVPVAKLAADVDAELERKVKVHGSPSSDLFYSTAL